MNDRDAHTIVGGVGYRDLRDHSAGPLVTDRLAGRVWTPFVQIHDLSYNPVAVSQWLTDDSMEAIDRLIFVGAVARGDVPVGSVRAYRWDQRLPSPERVQAAVSEAVTGVISLDNTLIVTRQFGGLPDDVIVVEIEPGEEAFGDQLSPPVAAVVDGVCDLVAQLAVDTDAVRALDVAPMGGSAHTRVTV